MLIEAGQDDGQPHQVPDRPAMTVIRLDLAGSGLSVTGSGGEVLVPDGLVIGFDTGPSLATVQRLILVAAAGVLAAILALVAATVVIVSRSLRPLKAMSERAHAFAEGDRSVRLPVPDDDPDMHRLAVAVNEAFDVQETAEGRLRSFVADASHELRTPLTTATGWIELYLQGGLTDEVRRDHAMERAMTQLGRMRVLIDELALLARLDRTRPLDLDPIDLTALATEVLDDARVINPDASVLAARGRSGDAAGRCAEAAAGAAEPARQRGPAHPGRHAGRGDRPTGPAGRQWDGRRARWRAHAARHRPRSGDPGRGPGPRLHPVWRGDTSRTRHTRRRRSGSGDRVLDRLRARRHVRRDQPGRSGHDDPDPAAGSQGGA